LPVVVVAERKVLDLVAVVLVVLEQTFLVIR
jgi:hypothetical protein